MIGMVGKSRHPPYVITLYLIYWIKPLVVLNASNLDVSVCIILLTCIYQSQICIVFVFVLHIPNIIYSFCEGI